MEEELRDRYLLTVKHACRALDVPVFPVSADKKPFRGSQGFKDATTDPDTIHELWQRWPNANVAIPTGPLSNTVVIDCDPRKGGLESLDQLISECGRQTFETQTHRTPSGGFHYFYSYPDRS